MTAAISEKQTYSESIFIRIPGFSDGKTLLSSQAIFAGDFNFHVDDVHNNFSNKFLGMIESFNLYQQVREITHEKGHILDLVLANNDSQTFKISNIRVEQCGISDHHIVLFDLNVDKPRPLHKTINYRQTKNIDIPAFINDIKNSGLTNEVSKSATVSDKVDSFNRYMKNILDIHAPFKTKNIVCRPNTRWFNREISEAKKTQREAERTWRNSKLEVHRQIFVETRNKTHKLIVRAKKKHLRENILNKKPNSKELYKVVNGFLKPSIGSQCLPSNYNTDALTEKFAFYFTEKISKIREELDIMENVTPSVKEMSARIGKYGLDSFEPVTETEVNKILKNLSKKTCSLDVVPTWLIIECADSLTPAITSIVNCSLESGEMPVDLKKAIVKHLLKKADLDRECLKNYRPVSNLSCLSKIIEKVVASRLHTYLNQRDIFPKFQSAYRQKHSTETALTRVQNDIIKLKAKKQHVMLVLLDLSAAFDTIDKDILCHRLRTYFGISNLALKWLNSYLNNRSMSVSIENSFSAPTPVRFGVP